MRSFVQLFDLASGNVIGDYADERAAWTALHILASEYGPDELRDLGLLRFENGQPSLIAMDDELIDRVLEAANVSDPVEISSS